jgi:hypothetical protein
MIFLLLSCGRLMTIEAIDALACMLAHFVLMHDGILRSPVALRAFSACADEIGRWLLRFDLRSCAIDQERCQYQSKRNYDSDEDGAERHATSSPAWSQPQFLGALKQNYC